MILLCLLTIIIIFVIQWEIKRRKVFWYLRNFKSPKILPILGAALDFADPKNGILTLLKYYKECGNNYYSYIGSLIILNATEPDLVECILGSTKLIDKSDDYKFLKRWFKTGLLTSTGSMWKIHRKIITPSFHYKILEDFVEVFDKGSNKLVKKLNNEVGNDSFNIFEYVTLCGLDILCETAMGTIINAQDNPNSEYVKSTKRMCDMFYKRVFSPFLRIDILYYCTKMYQQEIKDLKVIHDLTDSVIKKRREALLNGSNNDENVDDCGIKSKHHFLDTLLKGTANGVPLTDEEIRQEVDTFMFAGHDTSSVSISFTLYLLSKHLDVQNKVCKEIKSLLGDDKDKPVTYDILQQMKYLEMVIKESLRLCPSVPVYVRRLNEDTPFKGEIIPKGLDVAIIPYLLHRNPVLYPDPEKFDPERFSFENSKNRHPYAYVPFSAGSRNCIGQKFAMLEMKSVISKVLRYYKVVPTLPEHYIWPIAKVTLQSENGIKIRLETRK